ncbi:MAG: hypothetical protein QY310_05160 [Candidatus Jettenia sp. CY-1]|nr:MAG: hypothetical protein QY310_05160 [Candidatus Jettenia sp. CY-1]
MTENTGMAEKLDGDDVTKKATHKSCLFYILTGCPKINFFVNFISLSFYKSVFKLLRFCILGQPVKEHYS